MKVKKTLTSGVLVAASLLLVAAGCQFGSAPQGGAGPTATVTGTALKGIFQPGAIVTAINANNPSQTATGTIIDNQGTYSVNITWSGPTIIRVSGPFIDDFTGQVQQQPASAPLTAVVNATAGQTATGQVNVATSIAATIIQNAVNAGLPVATTDVTTTNNTVAKQILGLTSTADISQVNPRSTTDPNAGQLLAFNLAVAANSGTANVAAAITQLANNVQNGQALGTPVGGLTNVVSSTQLQTNLTAIANNTPLTVTGVGTVSVATAVANSGTGQTQSNVSSNTNPNNTATVLRGFAIAGNTLTIGTANGTVAVTSVAPGAPPQGIATITGTTATNNVKAGFTFKEYTNAAGTGSSSSSTYAFTFTFAIFPTSPTDKRTIVGSVTPVQLITNGSGAITNVVVPVGAVFTFTGTDMNGTALSGTFTARTGDATFFSQSGTQSVINANQLLQDIQSRAGLTIQQLQTLTIAGTYTFTFGFSLPVGIDNSGSTALAQLLPQTSAVVAGNAVTGQLTLF